jgi:Dolichyl-phosphate-mannose-protein mannosyltransferase
MTKKTHILLLLLILAAGFLLRYTGFVWGQGYRDSAITDELDAYRAGLRLLAGEREALYIAQPNFPHKGTGHLPGPLLALFWATPLRFGGGPEAVMVLLIALDTLVIYIVYVLAKRMLDATAALWAALFYATAPWPLYYSIGCWNPQFLAPLGALLVLALWDVMTHSQSRKIFWVCLLQAMMPQFHAFGLFLGPSILLLLGFRRREINKTWLALGLLGCLALYTPYIFGEVGTHWDNTRRVLGGGENSFTFGCLKSLTLLPVCLSNLFNSALSYSFRVYEQFGRAEFGSFWVLLFFNLLSLGLGIVFVGNLLVEFARAVRGHWRRPQEAFERAPAIVFISLMVLLPLLVFLPTGRNFSSRYLVLQLPLLSLLPAMWITKLPSLPRVRYFGTACLVLTTVFNVVLCLAFYRFQARQIADGPYFIPSFRHMEQVRQELLASAVPDRRIELDTSAFPVSPQDKQGRGLHALADYVGLCERYRRPVNDSQAVQLFRAQAETNFVDAGQIVVHQGNGIALVTPRS